MIITPEQLKKWLDEKRSVRVVDIRSEEMRIQEPLVHLDTEIIPEEELDINTMDNDPVVLICQFGQNTERFVQNKNGRNLYSLLGGAQAWNEYVETKVDFSRYARQMVLPQVGVEGQLALAAAKVTIVGMGGLGCPVVQYLAAAGVGTLQIIDGDVVELSNLQRQPLYRLSDVGLPKVDVAAERIVRINPEVKAVTINVPLSHKNRDDLLTGTDIIVDATDSLTVRHILDGFAAEHLIPLVYGGLYRFEGQVSVFNHNGGPRYADLFPEHSMAGDNCTDAGVLGMLPGIIGNIQALETMKIILGLEPNLTGKLLIYDGLSHETNIIELG